MVVGLRAVFHSIHLVSACAASSFLSSHLLHLLPHSAFTFSLATSSLTLHCSALGSHHWTNLVKASVVSLGNQPCWKAPVCRPPSKRSCSFHRSCALRQSCLRPQDGVWGLRLLVTSYSSNLPMHTATSSRLVLARTKEVGPSIPLESPPGESDGG
ncbi:hypothetical protein PF010_g6307 [Phytophthora fragariae]|uniref:Secreted protein n=1 Tax=Phytophthora fragariae TaxID=53985 RepID=A0A6A3UFD7_9STRA|nr:hypothetical protein PF009_g7776 [Phytophthora fragariae]KAE9004159.1 hypothetical protein PF011_g12564 [Phytophthora fragariae]KAE9122692.1 hypothetical protein PF007_g7352 [Phytophthora fragariae]KAE9123697.1 hypothetical protein PF010_g6307 [Phytophthora fragariae]KAE9149341.1 hypothetical protein PF006_g6180 [Phytophthora fragariae]